MKTFQEFERNWRQERKIPALLPLLASEHHLLLEDASQYLMSIRGGFDAGQLGEFYATLASRSVHNKTLVLELVGPGRRPAEPRLFRIIAIFLPRRLWVEDLGDALEELEILDIISAPRWQRWAKIGSTCLWLVPNVIREWTSALKGSAGSGSQRKGGRQ